jgi:hypothetical protein
MPFPNHALFATVRRLVPALALAAVASAFQGCWYSNPTSDSGTAGNDSLALPTAAVLGPTDYRYECRFQGDVPTRDPGEVSTGATYAGGCKGDPQTKNGWYIINVSTYASGEKIICADDDRQSIPYGWYKVGGAYGTSGGGCNLRQLIRKDKAPEPVCKYTKFRVNLVGQNSWDVAPQAGCTYAFFLNLTATKHTTQFTINAQAYVNNAWTTVKSYTTPQGAYGKYRIYSKAGSVPTITCYSGCGTVPVPPAPAYCPYTSVTVTESMYSYSATTTYPIASQSGKCASTIKYPATYLAYAGERDWGHSIKLRYTSSSYVVPAQEYTVKLPVPSSPAYYLVLSGYPYTPSTKVLGTGSITTAPTSL